MRPMKTVFRATFVLLALAMSGCVMTLSGSNFLQPNNATLSHAELEATELPAGYKLTLENFRASDDTKLSGLLLASPEANATILFFGPQGSSVGQGGLDVAKRIAALGENAFIINYRGSGGSGGKPTVRSMMTDAVSAYDFLSHLTAGYHRPIAVLGVSMGSFVASSLATKRPIAGLVLVSPGTDVHELVKNLVPWYAKPFVVIKLSRDLKQVNNITRLKDYRGPLLILAGEQDQVTPVAMAKELLRAASSPQSLKHLFVVPDARHARELHRPISSHVYTVYREFIGGIVSGYGKNAISGVE